MRASDRWVTPGVVIVGLVVAGGLLALTVVAVAWLTARGVDPDPMLRLVAEVGGSLSGVMSLLLQLANRRTVAKTERNTGQLASAVFEVADAMPRPVVGPRHAYPDTGAAPVASGS